MHISTAPPDYDDYPFAIRWDWAEGGSYPPGGTASFEGEPDILTHIIVSLPLDPTLGEVIQAYGEPSHVAAWAFRDTVDSPHIQYGLEVLWLDQGLGLKWDGFDEPPKIDLDARRYYLLFFEPGLEGFVAMPHNVVYNESNLARWQGVRDFWDYVTCCESAP